MAAVEKLPPIKLPLVEDALASHTLPARWYTDPAIFEREKQAIFYRTWHYVGHRSQVAKAGDFVTGMVADQRVFALRGHDGVLRAFHNTCRHRGHHLVKGTGNVGLFVTCPYHLWAYDAQGKLRTARNCQHLKDFRREDFPLLEIAVEDFCGLIFVNLDRSAKSLAAQMVGLEADIRARIPDLDAMRPVRTFEFGNGIIKANWKVVVDNFVECYHCGPTHPAFAQILDMERYRQDDHGLWSRQIGVRTQANETIYPIGADDPVQEGLFWYLWPTTTINLLPGRAELNVSTMSPRGHLETAFVGHQYSPTGTIDETRLNYVTDILGIEDRDLCESVQQGLGSLAFDQGRIVVDAARSGISEHALHRFHLLVREALEA